MEMGMRYRCSPPPPPPQPPVLPLHKWLQSALEKESAVCRKAAAVPWSAQVLDQGCGPNQPIFLTLARVTTACVGSCADFSGA